MSPWNMQNIQITVVPKSEFRHLFYLNISQKLQIKLIKEKGQGQPRSFKRPKRYPKPSSLAESWFMAHEDVLVIYVAYHMSYI